MWVKKDENHIQLKLAFKLLTVVQETFIKTVGCEWGGKQH